MHSLCMPARPASKNIIDYVKGNSIDEFPRKIWFE
jgi:hypothetical protein